MKISDSQRKAIFAKLQKDLGSGRLVRSSGNNIRYRRSSPKRETPFSSSNVKHSFRNPNTTKFLGFLSDKSLSKAIRDNLAKSLREERKKKPFKKAPALKIEPKTSSQENPYGDNPIWARGSESRYWGD